MRATEQPMLFNFQPGQTWWPYRERAPKLSVSRFVRWVFRCLKERSEEENRCGSPAGLGGWGLLSRGTSMVKEAVPCAWKTEGRAALAHTCAVHVRVPSFLGATSLLPHSPFLSGSRGKLVFLRSLILWLAGTSKFPPWIPERSFPPWTTNRYSEGEDCVSVIAVLHLLGPRRPVLHTESGMEPTTGCSGSFLGKKGGFVSYTDFPSASADISEFEEHYRNVVVGV